MDQKNVAFIYNGILLKHKEEWNFVIHKYISQSQKAKIVCHPLYVDYRTKTNAVILLDMSQTLSGEHAQEK
jgi:hypothetical protein